MTRTPKTLATIGQALYGPGYQAPLSHDLDVSPRTMRRWLKGEFAIPDGVWAELRTLCRESGERLADWADKLS